MAVFNFLIVIALANKLADDIIKKAQTCTSQHVVLCH